MRISQRCVDLVKQFEGFSAKPYKCPANVWTIGYGSTKGVTENTPPITEAEATQLLHEELQGYAKEVAGLVTVSVTQNQFDALVSFHYNTGALGKSTLLKKLNAGFYDAAAREFLKWTKASGKVLGGLVKRRGAEMSLFLEG